MNLDPATAERYLRRAFRKMLAVVDRLGDERVNVQPHGDGTNSAAALVVHCCGVTEFWLGHVALGRPSTRDRAGEFVATASVAELHDIVDRTIATAVADIDRLDAGEGNDDSGGRSHLLDGDGSDGSAVLHVLEEIYQHLGHMELTADALGERSPPAA
ncbi:MAG: DinB family protein [Acidimicrobiia bacterium]|nr:DinB family protein [Acidimicrobiia bacterium]